MAAEFSISDPAGSTPVTSRGALLNNCQGSVAAFATIQLTINQAFIPGIFHLIISGVW